MPGFIEAREKAREMFVENGYFDREPDASDLPDKWLFFDTHFAPGIADYGACAISVKKDDGIPEWYQCFSPDNLKEYLSAVPIAFTP